MKLIFFYIGIFCLIGGVLYNWHNYKNHWKNSIVKKNILNWYGSSIVYLKNINNYYSIEVLDILNHSFIVLDEWNIESLKIDDQLQKLQLLKNNNSIIYIITTKFPISIILEYIQKKNIIINTPFIIMNNIDDQAIVHNYFFNKSTKTNDYNLIPIINLNKLLSENISIKEFINLRYPNGEFFLFYSNDNNYCKLLLNEYQESKKNYDN
jgi:hypothetical protein